MEKRVRDNDKQSAYMRAYYSANRQSMIDAARVSKAKCREKSRVFILDYLSTRACLDCGESDPIVLEFDHRGEKEFNLSEAMQRGFGLKRIALEMNKCDIRCANCHRRKTYVELGFSHRG